MLHQHEIKFYIILQVIINIQVVDSKTSFNALIREKHLLLLLLKLFFQWVICIKLNAQFYGKVKDEMVSFGKKLKSSIFKVNLEEKNMCIKTIFFIR